MGTATAHKHRLPAGPALVTAARSAFERAGDQWTDLRATVFDVLINFEKPASAYEITDAVSKATARRVTANTVYRILDLFVASNIAARVESSNAYIATAHPDCRHDCIFLVCDRCGKTSHIDDDRIAGDMRAAASATGFMPLRPVLEVRGLCADCA
ncbi:Fur family transcriptional regulator [Glacieibacterium megasporae]|uniref:Fur family transcriptional regulator n=1 Tax=Glacieibacterium megasporae TaxID=2835787 RepID=UPI001C1E5B2C|nr:transcriptional repressor [Polymorphobacter megasporae]UAJ12758.1 transcriptional repressor [Polymorphobacter megasporae]